MLVIRRESTVGRDRRWEKGTRVPRSSLSAFTLAALKAPRIRGCNPPVIEALHVNVARGAAAATGRNQPPGFLSAEANTAHRLLVLLLGRRHSSRPSWSRRRCFLGRVPCPWKRTLPRSGDGLTRKQRTDGSSNASTCSRFSQLRCLLRQHQRWHGRWWRHHHCQDDGRRIANLLQHFFVAEQAAAVSNMQPHRMSELRFVSNEFLLELSDAHRALHNIIFKELGAVSSIFDADSKWPEVRQWHSAVVGQRSSCFGGARVAQARGIE